MEYRLLGGAALMISTFQVFIALGSVLGGHIVDTFGTSAVMWCGGGAALTGLLFVSLSRHSLQPVVAPSLPQPELACSCGNEA